jgi:hypothetical protein
MLNSLLFCLLEESLFLSYLKHIARSSKGRTSLSESDNFGSIPNLAAKTKSFCKRFGIEQIGVGKESSFPCRKDWVKSDVITL